MNDTFPTPPAHATLEERGDTLRVFSGADEPTLEVRVDGGLVFVRHLAAGREVTPVHSLTPPGGLSRDPSRQWKEASLDFVIELFADNSPIASWLRQHGVDVLRLALLEVGGLAFTAGEAF